MIKINDKYFIDADRHCYMLKALKEVRDNESKGCDEDHYEILGFYVSLESLLKGLLKKELRQYISKSNQDSIKDLKEKIIDLEKNIESLNINI